MYRFQPTTSPAPYCFRTAFWFKILKHIVRNMFRYCILTMMPCPLKLPFDPSSFNGNARCTQGDVTQSMWLVEGRGYNECGVDPPPLLVIYAEHSPWLAKPLGRGTRKTRLKSMLSGLRDQNSCSGLFAFWLWDVSSLVQVERAKLSKIVLQASDFFLYFTSWLSDLWFTGNLTFRAHV